MKPVFDPNLQDEIPAWVITHMAEVSAWMKERGHEHWSIGGGGGGGVMHYIVDDNGRTPNQFAGWVIKWSHCGHTASVPDFGMFDASVCAICKDQKST